MAGWSGSKPSLFPKGGHVLLPPPQMHNEHLVPGEDVEGYVMVK